MDRTVELVLQPGQTLARNAQRIGLARIGVNHEGELAEHVVHHREFLRAQQQHVGQSDRIGFLDPGEALFDEAHCFVAEVPHQSTGKARQALQRRGVKLLQVLAHEHQRVGLRNTLHRFLAVGAAPHDAQLRAAPFDALVARQADVRVAAEALAADHRLEQVGIRLLRELQVERHRRIEIGANLRHHRDAVVALAGQLLEFELGHGP